MRMPAVAPISVEHQCNDPEKLNPKCNSCEEEKEETLLRKEGSVFAAADPPPPEDSEAPSNGFSSVKSIINSGGRPLDRETQRFFEPRFGMNLGHIRIHTDTAAGHSARSVNARAYTIGNNIVFGIGEYLPNRQSGKLLLAHEIAHVAQSSRGSSRLDRSVIYRQPDGEEDGTTESEAPMTRAEEIALSHSSPGLIAAESAPLTLSLFNFAIDVSNPKAEHRTVLGELGRFLSSRASVQVTVRSIGFADASGPAGHNLGLSRRRATQVKRILDPLVSQRISVSAYGETNPAGPNDTVEGRSRNRRVDIKFAADRPPGPVPPRPEPVPPGETPIPEPPVPIPPRPEPPGAGGGDDTSFCEDYPILCGIGLLPFFGPLICLVAPEICVGIACALLPELCIPPIPPVPPTPPTPPEPPEPPEDGQPMVMFIPNVRANNTPAGMNDRIGIRDADNITAVVTNAPPPTSPIRVFISDNNSGAGNATINGQREILITGTTALTVLGTLMTTGNYVYSPYIQLGAWWSGRLVGDSNRFAVSSIMQDWEVIDAGSNVGRYGYVSLADMKWVSDSGLLSHLDECRYVERVGLIVESGGMAGMGIGEVDDPDDVNTGEYGVAFDEHGTPFDHTRNTHREGTSRLKQLWTIRDMRSNSPWAASMKSGFEIHRTYERDPQNMRCWHLLVRKFGSAVSVGGWIAGAGSGDYTHEFRNIDCDPPPHVEPPPPHGEPPEPEVPPAEPRAPDPCCDRPEMARRVDICIENAKQDAIDCTWGLVPFSGGWGGIGSGIEYLICLEQLKRDLLECDRRAKRDTNCPDVNTPPDCDTDDPGGGLYAQNAAERFIAMIPDNPSGSDEDNESIT